MGAVLAVLSNVKWNSNYNMNVPELWHKVTSVVQQPDVLCVLFVSGESKEQAKPSRVSQLSQREGDVHESLKEIQFQPSLINVNIAVCF